MMMSIWIGSLLGILLLQTLCWMGSFFKKDASIADLIWGLGFVVIMSLSFVLGEFSQRSLLLLVLVSVWGLRLTVYLTARNWAKPEDPRYQAMRQKNPNFQWASFWRVNLLQGVIQLLVGWPLVLMAQSNDAVSKLGIWDVLLVLIWMVGFMFEAGGDWQLANFKRNPMNRGKPLDHGFWAWTRHPNYFGDSVQWWAFAGLVFLQTSNFWVFLSPLLMTFLLLKVSGVSLLEKSLLVTKPGYKDYVARTPAFFPRIPKAK